MGAYLISPNWRGGLLSDLFLILVFHKFERLVHSAQNILPKTTELVKQKRRCRCKGLFQEVFSVAALMLCSEEFNIISTSWF